MSNIPLERHIAANDSGGANRLGRLAYSVPEAAAAIGIGKTKLYALIGQGVLRSTLIGKRRIIPADDLHALIAGNQTKAA